MFLLFLDIVVFDAHILLSYTVISFSGSLLLCTDVMVIVGAYLWICSGSIQSSSAHTSAHIFLLYFLLFKLLIFFFKFSINLEYSSNSLFITDPKQEAMLTVMYKFFFSYIFQSSLFSPNHKGEGKPLKACTTTVLRSCCLIWRLFIVWAIKYLFCSTQNTQFRFTP